MAGARGRRSVNFSLLVSHVLVPPALEAIARFTADNRVRRVSRRRARVHGDGHRGIRSPSRQRYRVPIVVTGFEPVDILHGRAGHVRAAAGGGPRGGGERSMHGRCGAAGNQRAQQAMIRAVFEVVPIGSWRGLGEIPAQRSRTPPEPMSALRRRAAPWALPDQIGEESTRVPQPAKFCAACSPGRPQCAGVWWTVARPSSRWARRWSRPKGRARPTTATGEPNRSAGAVRRSGGRGPVRRRRRCAGSLRRAGRR
jgi:hypothetical protein